MSKKCPTCGKRLPNGVQFCPDCGHSFNKAKLDIFSNGKIFIVLIVAVLVIGGIFILTYSTGGDNENNNVDDDGTHVFLTITDVSGWDGGSSSKNSYTLYTSALFTKVPDNIDGYMLKTIYYDKNNSQIGQETESLEQIYYDSDYSISFGHYTTYIKPNPDYVVVQIIKDGNIIDNYTETIDQSKIDYLN